VGEVRHIETFGENMYLTTRRTTAPCDQADELPGSHPGVQAGAAQLSRAAAAPGRVRQGPSVRAFRRVHGSCGCARSLKTTRIFLYPDQITSERSRSRAHLEYLPRFRLRRCADQVLGPAAEGVGSDEIWDKAEAALRQGRRRPASNHVEPREGAFNGPKLEFVLRDASGAIGSAHPAGGLQPPVRSARPISAKTARAHPGHAAPGDVWVAGAIYRDFDRTPCGQTAYLAGTGPGRVMGITEDRRNTAWKLRKPEKSAASGRNGLEE